ncbi:pseudouridine synthase [Saccharopolyspora hordei]|mgnify:CR=1 FL=1|uniref:RNA pseudouridylate synthase n=1 Tax=Saccharopolyspora hordei TaxID=1838 RepID=A0A853AS00_9PSEU|nr:pseudouridine synthase [Saccharopolyspora hordei]NYI84560.1 tRNA pseudouridine32 synthase/23S rRNA pseudouridine746 synthase [Saccharopolyspora hordei]
MRRKPSSPLPQRHGVDPVRMRLPLDGRWRTVRDHLVDRIPKLSPDRIDAMLSSGRIVSTDGPLTLDSPFVPGAFVWFHRDLPVETPVPFAVDVLHRDEHLLVVDKPHFLATTPRGGHVVETALVRLRRELDLPQLSPAHRLDRLTAGLVMFVITPEHRGAYQSLFHDRSVHKEYEAVARVDPDLELPRTVRSRIRKQRGVLRAEEVPGEPNSETRVELVEHRGGLGRYRLLPRTGRTHQLRVHMNRLGVPILGDDLYPVVRARAADDFSSPLQLLATVLEFTDPITGRRRRFESRRTLGSWTGRHDERTEQAVR